MPFRHILAPYTNFRFGTLYHLGAVRIEYLDFNTLANADATLITPGRGQRI